LAELKEKFKTTRDFFDNRIVPIDLMQDFGNYIAYLVEEPEERLHSEADLKKFFFEEFVGGICKRIITIKQIDSEVRISALNGVVKYEHLIEKIVMNLCDLFVKEIEKDNSDMADGMRYLFDITSYLHQNVF